MSHSSNFISFNVTFQLLNLFLFSDMHTIYINEYAFHTQGTSSFNLILYFNYKISFYFLICIHYIIYLLGAHTLFIIFLQCQYNTSINWVILWS